MTSIQAAFMEMLENWGDAVTFKSYGIYSEYHTFESMSYFIRNFLNDTEKRCYVRKSTKQFWDTKVADDRYIASTAFIESFGATEDDKQLWREFIKNKGGFLTPPPDLDGGFSDAMQRRTAKRKKTGPSNRELTEDEILGVEAAVAINSPEPPPKVEDSVPKPRKFTLK